MARMTVDFFSQVLQMCTSMTVIVPEPTEGMIGQSNTVPDEPPLLYLLHGLSDDHSVWSRRTSVERYAASYGMAIVMPGVGRSWYTDMEEGQAYWTFVSRELPQLVATLFRLTSSPQSTFVAGLSMGGYGAMKLALNFPERFAAAASFSGAVGINEDDPPVRARADSDDPNERKRAREMRRVFGDPPKYVGTHRDLAHLASTYSRESGGKPRLPIYLACGTEDFLYQGNTQFRDLLAELGYDMEYREGHGEHEWGYWDYHIRLFFEWLVDRGLLVSAGHR